MHPPDSSSRLHVLPVKKIFLLVLVCHFLANVLFPLSASASPWAEKEGYLGKTAGKFGYGLKNSVFGWTALFTEPYTPPYQEQGGRQPWEGFWVGLSKSAFYTTNGLIHLATFPIPVDIPDIGKGV